MRSRFTDEQIIAAIKENEAGAKVDELCHRHGIRTATWRGAAVVEFGRVRLSGPLAWLTWAIAHVYFLIGARNRMLVALNWCWTYLGRAERRAVCPRRSAAHDARRSPDDAPARTRRAEAVSEISVHESGEITGVGMG